MIEVTDQIDGIVSGEPFASQRIERGAQNGACVALPLRTRLATFRISARPKLN
ncbi:hypothetical protein NSU_2282 [Novosphingobium pentaromativorans US6-1]|uniref:Uncharacterized protein n=1 Tax=Novosphingobium pentaromativorans US6-1 TaxID=1088721 RepID=G6ED61_9SPHN|nr:hypothetical protein NSU_2282 [Novosphingobium pentaromativorans US6-1]